MPADLPRPRPARSAAGRAADRAARTTSGSRRRRCGQGSGAGRGGRGRRRGEPAGAPRRPRGAGTAARRIHRSCSDPSSRPTTASATAATPASAAPPTATSPRRSAAIPTCVVHRALLAALGEGEEAPRAAEAREVAWHCSERERESMRIERDADDVCAAFLLERELWRARRGGGLRGRGLRGDPRPGPSSPSAASWATSTRASCRRGAMRGDERFELNETETALVGRESGRDGAARRPGRGPGDRGRSAPRPGRPGARRRLSGSRRARRNASRPRATSPPTAAPDTNSSWSRRWRQGSCCAARR